VTVASPRNFAFIDGQNLNGFIPDNQPLYTRLQKAGYTVVFKPVTYRGDGKPKGNVDAELVLQAMIEYPHHERAVIVTGDGDFGCLVRHLYNKGKLERVLSPNRRRCSALLKRAARERLDFLEEARGKIQLKACPFLVSRHVDSVSPLVQPPSGLSSCRGDFRPGQPGPRGGVRVP